MNAARRCARRRWALYAVAAAVVLYGIVGFPDPDEAITDPEALLNFDVAPAAADTQRTCISYFWGPVKPPVCQNRAHSHPRPKTKTCRYGSWSSGKCRACPSGQVWISGSGCRTSSGCSSGRHKHGNLGCHSPSTSHGNTNQGNGGNTNQGNGGNNQGSKGGGDNGNDGSTKQSKSCTTNQRWDAASKRCVYDYSRTADCAGDLTRDPVSRLCVNLKTNVDPDKPGAERPCADRRQWVNPANPDAGCVVKTRADDPERSRYCPAGQAFYSTLLCQNPCDGGQTVVNGQCVTVRQPAQPQNPQNPQTPQTPQTPQNPQNPQNPQDPPPATECPPGYTGTPPNCQKLPKPTAYVTVAGDDVVDEGTGTVSVTVTLSHKATEAATVVLATADGTATAGSDYIALTAQTGAVSFAVGDQQKQAVVVVIDDTIDEADETFTVSVASASGGAQVPPEGSSVEFTIVDNDPPPLAAANFTIECGPDTDGKLYPKFLWDHPLDDPRNGEGLLYDLRVGYSLGNYDNSITEPRRAVHNSAGELVGGLDSADPSGNGRPWGQYRNGFRAGATVYASIIPGRRVPKIITKLIQGEPQTFTYLEMDFGHNNTNYAVGACPARPSVSLSPLTQTVAEDAGTAELTVSLSAAWAVPVTVDVTAEDVEAAAGSDYTAPAGAVTFAAGETTASVSVPIIDDTDTEPDETFRVAISDPTGGATVPAVSSRSVVTITDNDEAEQQQQVGCSAGWIYEPGHPDANEYGCRPGFLS